MFNPHKIIERCFHSSLSIFFAWWFLMAGPAGNFSPRIYMVIGPFDTKVACEGIMTRVAAEKGNTVFECWEGSAYK